MGTLQKWNRLAPAQAKLFVVCYN